MAIKITSAWHEDNRVHLVSRDARGVVSTRSVPARWEFFATGLDESDCNAIARDRRSVGVKQEGPYTRIQCRNKWARKDLIELLQRASHSNDSDVQILEADVSPVRRILSDVGSIEIETEPRLGFFDLETDSRATFDQAREGHARVLSWSLCDIDERPWSGLLREDSDHAESDLLRKFFEQAQRFDILLAWNGDGFDFPVLRGRIQNLSLTLNGHPIPWFRWAWLDQMQVYKKYNADSGGEEKSSLKLNHVAQHLLGEGKDEFDASKTWEAWEAGGKSRKELLLYNVKDTKLLPGIEKKTGFVSLHVAASSICRLVPDSSSLRATAQGDGYLLRLGSIHNYRFPTRPNYEDIVPNKFLGAYVMEPMRFGAIDNVHVADFSGLYPSIMRTWNMSPDTKVEGNLRRKLADQYSKSNGEPVLAKNVCQLPNRPTWFRTDEDGMLRIALNDLVAKRGEYNTEMKKYEVGSVEQDRYKRLSAAFKIVANSFYGITGSPYSRFYDQDIAEGVTQTGKWLIQSVIEAAKNEGLDPLYGDSIAADRPVVLKRPDGQITIRSVEHFWSLSEYEGETSDKESSTLDGWKALAKDDSGTEGWFPLRRIIRHKVDKEMWSISTKDGQTEVTKDHSLMVDGKKTAPKEFVSKGLEFECVSAFPPEDFGSEEVIDILPLAKEVESSIPYKGRYITRRFDVDPCDDSKIVLVGWGTPKIRIDRYYYPGSEKLNSLLRVCAAYISDGSSCLRGTTTSRYSWSICKKDQDLLNDLKSDLSMFIHGATWTGPFWSKGSNVYLLRSGTAALSIFFASLCGYKSTGKRLPEFIYRLNESHFRVFFDQLEKGDGYTDPSGQMKYGSNSSTLMAQLSYLLGIHGIEHTHGYRSDKHHWSVRTRPIGSKRNRHSVRSECRDAKGETVYDLQVDGAHTFVDGVGRVLLHNTDSVFVQGDSDEFKSLVNKLNSEWPERIKTWGVYGKHYIDLDFEKTFSRLIMIAKKRYAGKFAMYKGKEARDDAAPEVKGLEFKRGDTIRFARDMQSEIVHLILNRKEIPDTSEIREIISRWENFVLNEPLKLEDVKISQSLSKKPQEYNQKSPPAHVRIAMEMQERGEAIGEGSRVAYVVTGSKNGLDAISADEPNAVEKADRAYYWERRVFPASSRILEKVYPQEVWAESRGKKKQRSLEMGGQQAMDFSAFGSTTSAGRVRRRKRKKATPSCTLRIREHSPSKNGGAESHRRTVILEAIRAAIEAYPGKTPVKVRVEWIEKSRGQTNHNYKMSFDTGLCIDPSRESRMALERIVGRGNVFGIDG